MELTFSQLRTKDVINTQDGKKLGKVCDIVLRHPENCWMGLIVPGNRGWTAKKNGLFIDFKHVVKIGEDVILVNLSLTQKPAPPRPRNYEDYE